MTDEELDLREDDFLNGFCAEDELLAHCKALAAEVRRLRSLAEAAVSEGMKIREEREEARAKARQFWGTIKLYIRSQKCFTEAQNKERIARALEGHEWMELDR
jgi:uncharacterized coiled-coil DUF342 family protein